MSGGTPSPRRPQFLDNFGRPVSRGRVFYYQAGTTRLRDTFSDAALSQANPNPVVLDLSGRASIFLSPGVAYRVALQNVDGVPIWTEDGIVVPGSVPLATDIPLFGSPDRGRTEESYPPGFRVADLVFGSGVAHIAPGFVVGTWVLEMLVRPADAGVVTAGLFNLDAETGPVIEIAQAFEQAANIPLTEVQSPEFVWPAQVGTVRYGVKQHSTAGDARIHNLTLRRIR